MTDPTDDPNTDARRAEDLERIEEARSEAAAYVVQRQPLEPGDIGRAEERIVDAVDAAQDESDPARLDDLAAEAEAGRDEIRRELLGKGSERTPEQRVETTPENGPRS